MLRAASRSASTAKSVGRLADVSMFLTGSADSTSAVTNAFTHATLSGLEGIYFPAGTYALGAVSVPGDMKIRAHQDAIITPYGELSNMFTLAGDNVDIADLNCVGTGSMQTNSGVGAVIVCEMTSSGGFYTLKSGADSTTNADIVVNLGGSGYVATGTDGTGDYFDYSVLDYAGTGGVVRCYVSGGVIVSAKVTAIGSGYSIDIASNPRMVIGRCYPSIWIYGVGRERVKVRDCAFQYGKRAISLDTCSGYISNNYIAEMGPNCNAIEIEDCYDMEVFANTVDGGYGGTHNPAGIRLTGGAGGVMHNVSISSNRVYNILIDGVGIGANIADIDGLNISDNFIEGCTGIGIEIKHGLNAGGASPGTLPEFDIGVHGVTYTGNVIRVPTGATGLTVYNNRRDQFEINIDDSNYVIGVGYKRDPDTGTVTYGCIMSQLTNSNISPTIIGKFDQGIQIQRARNCTFAPKGDGRQDIFVYAPAGNDYTVIDCKFPGEYTGAITGLRLSSATRPQLQGTRAIVRGQPVSSVALTAGGTGCNLKSQNVPFYFNGGGYGLRLTCTVVAGQLVTPDIAPGNSEDLAGGYYFDGGSGTFQVKVKQNGGSGGVLEVTVVDGAATAVSLISAGSGYLLGGDTTAGEPMVIEMGGDYVGYVTTDSSGNVTSVTTVDGGGHFVDTPVAYFASNVTWGVAPTLTPTMSASAVVGVYLNNVYGGFMTNAYCEGAQNGIRGVGETVLGFDVFNSTFKSVLGEPYNIEGTKNLGATRNITRIYGGTFVPAGKTLVSNVLWAQTEEVFILTSGAAQTIKTIKGHVGTIVIRITSASFSCTIDETGNIELGDAGASIVLTATQDFAMFNWDARLSKWRLIAYDVT